MSILPVHTQLGKLEIIEVYEYFDRPVLFACRNLADHLFLVVLEDEQENADSWLYVALSSTRFQQIRSGTLDLYHAFKLAENEFVLRVLMYHDKHPSIIEYVPADELQPDQLPEIGQYLNLPTSTLISPTHP